MNSSFKSVLKVPTTVGNGWFLTPKGDYTKEGYRVFVDTTVNRRLIQKPNGDVLNIYFNTFYHAKKHVDELLGVVV